jgi:hypothetical protein
MYVFGPLSSHKAEMDPYEADDIRNPFGSIQFNIVSSHITYMTM